MYFSKSKYSDFWECQKYSWLKKYKPEEEQVSQDAKLRFKNGNAVGELAKRLFGAYTEATVSRKDGSLDLPAMAEKTKRLMEEGTVNICEAAFLLDGLYCAVDILHREAGGYAIYEVKSTSCIKPKHYADVAYQKWMLEKCGVPVISAHVIILNTKYVRHGELDIGKLFLIDGGKDISASIAKEQSRVEELLKQAEKVLTCPTEPEAKINNDCKNCSYYAHCMKDVPSPSVLDLYEFDKKWDLFYQGIVTYEDLLSSGVSLDQKQKRQVDFALNDRGVYADKKEIKKFLDSLSYPLYFLDFETMQCVVPQFDGTHPYEQIPFQYSLHYLESEEGELHHAEFLAEGGADPRRAIAESLIENIPQGACTLAYHASTEQKIIENLAKTFPDLSERLFDISKGVKDLLPVFRKHYYKREIGGSFSIKSVLPAICPKLDYHDLEGVHNGTEAAAIFQEIKELPSDEAQKIRQQLLAYCKLDTLAEVVLWRELLKVSK